MNINIYICKKNIDKEYKSIFNEYKKRVSKNFNMDVKFIKKVKIDNPKTINILVDSSGKNFCSTEFADYFNSIKNSPDFRTINFILCKNYYDFVEINPENLVRLAVSSYDFSEEILLSLLSEQIYRAYTIISGYKYHK